MADDYGLGVALGRSNPHVSTLIYMAQERWGDVPVSIEINGWEDGEFQIEVFHTLGSIEPGEPVRARLIYDSHREKIAERLERITMSERCNTYYEQEVENDG